MGTDNPYRYRNGPVHRWADMRETILSHGIEPMVFVIWRLLEQHERTEAAELAKQLYHRLRRDPKARFIGTRGRPRSGTKAA